jgi:PadR family transcriptional regulator, regulatory protein PadR
MHIYICTRAHVQNLKHTYEGAHAAMQVKDLPEGLPQDLQSSRTNDHISQLEEEILTLLLGRELYGMQIIQAFRETSQGHKNIGPGSLYPTLARLEDKGLLTATEASKPLDEKGGARRKYYRITKRGASALIDRQKFRDQLFAWQPAV